MLIHIWSKMPHIDKSMFSAALWDKEQGTVASFMVKFVVVAMEEYNFFVLVR